MIYWRLSGFYLFYFASLGGLIPYWSLYLKALDFSIAEIGELVAILMATKIVAPNVWGWIADHTGHRMMIVRMASLLATIAFAGVFLAHGFWWLALVMTVFSFFWNAALPQFEATTMNHLGMRTHRYSSIRLWGSVGF
ncbi:MAG: MFS transporter, partial [Gammaproteobacteria bacterium]